MCSIIGRQHSLFGLHYVFSIEGSFASTNLLVSSRLLVFERSQRLLLHIERVSHTYWMRFCMHIKPRKKHSLLNYRLFSSAPSCDLLKSKKLKSFGCIAFLMALSDGSIYRDDYQIEAKFVWFSRSTRNIHLRQASCSRQRAKMSQSVALL